MQTAYPHGPAGGGNSIQPLPAVFFPNNMQISMFAARSPWELKAPPDIVKELNDYVVKRLKELREKENSGSHLCSKECSDDNNDSPLLQSHCNTFHSVDCHPTSSTCDQEDAERSPSSDHCTTAERLRSPSSDHCITAERLRSPSSDHCTAAERLRSPSSDHCTTATAEAGEEFGSKTSEANAELNAKSEEKSGTSASERISTEYPHIINEAAATCTKPSGGALTTVSGGTCDDPTDGSPCPTDGSPCPTDGSPCPTDGSSGPTDGSPCPTDGSPCPTDGSSGPTDGSSGPTDGSPGPTDGSPCPTDGSPCPTDGSPCPTDGSPCPTDGSPGPTDKDRGDRVIEDVNVHKQKAAGHQQLCPVTPMEATVQSSPDRILVNDTVTANQNKPPVYNQTKCKNTGQDVSSGVCSQVDSSPTCAECTPLSGPVDKDSPSVTVLKDPQYEDISDDEDMESELHEEFHFPFRLEDPDYEDISEDETPSAFQPFDDDDTECVSSARSDRAECGPSSDLKDEDETDDEMDDDWDIIPLIITELTLELPEDDPEDVGEQHVDNVTLCELQVSASAFPQIEVFDTCESFQLAKAVQFGKFPHNLSEESLEPKVDRSRRVSCHSEDSCETDDSCNYSHVEERNHLTVSAKLLNSRTAPSLTSSDSNHKVDDVVTDGQNDIIVLNSDTEDECDQVCTNDARRQKRLFSQDEVSDAAPCDPLKRYSSETKENSSKGRLLPAQCMTTDSAQLCDNMTIACERVQHDVTQQNVSDGESVIVIDSDNEDDGSQNCKSKRKREFCSEWAGEYESDKYESDKYESDKYESDKYESDKYESDKYESDKYESDKYESDKYESDKYESDKYESDEGKVDECRRSADSKVQHDSRDHQHSAEDMQDSCSNRSLKRGSEAETGSVCVQQKTNTQTTSTRFHESKHVVKADKRVKKKRKTKRRRRQDDDSAFINVLLKRPRVASNSQQNQSSKDSVIQEPNPQSGTGGGADTTAVIPRYSIQNFVQDDRPLKLFKQPVAYRRDKDASPKKHPTSKHLRSCQTKTQILHGDAQEKCVSNPKPGDERRPEQTHVVSKESSSPPSKTSPSFSLQPPEPFSILPSTSTPSYIPTKSAVTQLTKKWRESYYSTRRDKKTSVVMDEGLRPKNSPDLPKEAKPGRSHSDRPPRRRTSSQDSAPPLMKRRTSSQDSAPPLMKRRTSSQDSAPPLMKRTRVEARELTKARNRDASWDQLGHRVGEGYKWKK